MVNGMSRRAALVGAGLLAFAWSVPTFAAPSSFQVALSGSQEVPAVDSAGKGTADVTYDPATRLVTWSITYADLGSAVTMAHFHRGAPGQNGPVVIWLTKRGAAVQSPIKGSATLTAEQAQQFLAGDWYINVHTKNHPAGAIRGEVRPPKG
jgi:hypothetical protein